MYVLFSPVHPCLTVSPSYRVSDKNGVYCTDIANYKFCTAFEESSRRNEYMVLPRLFVTFYRGETTCRIPIKGGSQSRVPHPASETPTIHCSLSRAIELVSAL